MNTLPFRVTLLLLFLGSIVAANWLVVNLDPVYVGFGQFAPAGVYLVAVTLILRDLVQRSMGVLGVLAAFAGGAALSYVLATPEVATASLVAFVVSFLVDTLVYTTVIRVGGPLWLAALISGVVSVIPDSYIFLHILGLDQFIPGQILGKLVGTVCVACLLALVPARREPVGEHHR